MAATKGKVGPTSLVTRITCRVCDSTALTPVLSLGDHYIAGAFGKPGGKPPINRRVPLELVRCDPTRDQRACGLLQLRHTFPGEILYRSYWYHSGINRTMTKHLHEIARQAEEYVDLQASDLVVDIGCNDGTLLEGYTRSPIKRLGLDPSNVARYAEKKGLDVIPDFFSARRLKERYPNQKARVITSIAMFYDLEDPIAFVMDVADVLDERGIWVLELSYMPTMLEKNSFDTICHEHLEYYGLAVIERIIEDAGFEVLTVELNDTNGGSIRLFMGHRGKLAPSPKEQEALQALRIREFELALDSADPYERFVTNVQRVKSDLLELIRSLNKQGRTIHVYGASTKGNTILQYVGIDREVIPYAADRNPDKWGLETIGTTIPIISEEESRRLKPDYYLVLPWHFLDEFREREKEFLQQGGKFILPLPRVEIVG